MPKTIKKTSAEAYNIIKLKYSTVINVETTKPIMSIYIIKY